MPFCLANWTTQVIVGGYRTTNMHYERHVCRAISSFGPGNGESHETLHGQQSVDIYIIHYNSLQYCNHGNTNQQPYIYTQIDAITDTLKLALISSCAGVQLAICASVKTISSCSVHTASVLVSNPHQEAESDIQPGLWPLLKLSMAASPLLTLAPPTQTT